MAKSFSVALIHELEKYNKLLSIICTSLDDLIKALTGEAIMSQELEHIYSCILTMKVPPVWKIYDSLKTLGSWFLDMKSRVEFMRNWLIKKNLTVFRLSAFIFPQGFLTAILQTHARNYQIPIDELSFDFEVSIFENENQVKEPPKNGIYVSGMYLEGAMWDQGYRVIADLSPGQLYKPMNIMIFIPTDKEIEYDGNRYLCPVYKTAERKGVLTTTGTSNNFILAVTIPCFENNTDKWLLRGAALLTEIAN